jgi:hypothetical protein
MEDRIDPYLEESMGEDIFFEELKENEPENRVILSKSMF